MHKSRKKRLNLFGAYGDHKTGVMGMLDRETRQVRTKLIPDASRETLMNHILNHIEKGGTVYTDEHSGYMNMHQFVHETICHANEYVRGQVHTQGIENFWSLLKRGIKGTYVAVEPYHLSRYIDEQVFRYNHRIGHTDSTRFQKALEQVAGKRLTWNDLTGKEEAPEAFVGAVPFGVVLVSPMRRRLFVLGFGETRIVRFHGKDGRQSPRGCY